MWINLHEGADFADKLSHPNLSLFKKTAHVVPVESKPCHTLEKKTGMHRFYAPIDKKQLGRLVKYLKGIIIDDIQGLGTNTAGRQLAAPE
jgi:hypothetical protein